MDSEINRRPGGGRPDWIRAKAPSGPNFEEVMALVTDLKLHTVCQSAGCPNIGECWHERTATFLILGNTCTRNCAFCAVPGGEPLPADEQEPERVAEACAALSLRHVVVTSVTRDDLPDGGASIFAETIRAVRRRLPDCSIEVLIPDFRGSHEALRVVVEARPDVLNHNVETVPRMYGLIRPRADYEASLEMLRRAKEMDASMATKSGIMVGVGETTDEIHQTMRDLRRVGCDILTIGQYLRPSLNHAPIRKYYTPEEFEHLRLLGIDMAFKHIESGPLVRSSYHAARALGDKDG
ncbi:MAG: lipoyl synthase [Armatimonadota bacterium]|nr:lipoyl synthase [Armatimonadota bacterium]